MSNNNTIVIVDYNMGNLRSVEKGFARVGADVKISQDHGMIRDAAKIVLPGVGAFGDGMRNLHDLGLVEVLNQEVLGNSKPFLGICLGMQLVSSQSFENTPTKGFGWIKADVIRFDHSNEMEKIKIPHVGWNNVVYQHGNPLFKGIPDNSDFYFVHSYHFQSSEDIVTSTTEYGYSFTSSIQKQNIFAFQFHPEKSQQYGLKILKNFSELVME
ncbi:MAG: imidazole glycerol phosphate synthase subunit HisH [Candidatus Marinimicrobia bacterium]|nr:imidazole glycerol phosphate synthase subunit HisH [Candidatus Neomarinimicrobiota bacterium]